MNILQIYGVYRGVKAARKVDTTRPLENGQYWKIGEGHIHIVQIGKTLAQFKHFKLQNQKRVPLQMMNIASVQDYLKKNGAKLMKMEDAVAKPEKVKA